MKDKALGLLICIGIILYMINSIGPYIFIGLVVIALILIIVFLSINESAKSLNKEKTVYDQPSRTKLIDPIREGRVLSASIKSNSFVEDQKLIQSFVNAYNEVDNSLDTIKRMNKILRCCQRFYSKQAYTKRNLFSFIIEEANNAKQTTISPRLIRECETIITEMLQLKNGITTESIINQNIENKKQITQHLIKQDTRLNNFKVEDFNNSSEYHINSRIENINSFNKEEIPDTIEEAYVPIPVKKPTTFDEEYKIIQSLIKAHNESDNSVETNNWIIRILRFISKFYTKQASKNRNLFDFIIEEANYEILNAKPTPGRPKLIRECETIITEIEQLKNGDSAESIITKYSESKRQTIQQLVEQETSLDRLVTIQLSSDAQECKVEINESNISENNCLIKPIDSYRIRASKQVHESVSNDAIICSDIPNHEPIKLDNKTEELGKVVGDLQFWNNYYVNSSIGNNTASQQEKDLYVFFKKSFLNGIYGLEGNSNYSFILLFDLINDYKTHKDLAKVKSELRLLEDKYPKTKGYTIPALEKAMAQDIGIELTSKEPLILYVSEPFEPISEEPKKIIDPVPFWTHYYVYSAAGINTATQDQKDFYAFFKQSFLNGIYLDLEGNLNYAFILLFDLINDYKTHKDLAKLTVELQVLGQKYPKTKGYTLPALEKAISQESGIELLSKEHLILNEDDSLELIKKEENEKNDLFQRWNKLKSIRKSEIQNNFKETENPVIVVKETGENIFSIKKPIYQKPIFQIDADKLLIFEQDTVKSKEMLTTIFSSEEKSDDENSLTKINNDIYLKILAILLTKECWNRTDVELICKENNVLMGSALESINDYAYNLLNESVIDDDGEKLYITTEYKKQLLCQNL